MRHIVYISGTRADFGLMQATLRALHDDPALRLSVLVTGMHLDAGFGDTWQEIEAAGLTILGKVFVDLHPANGQTMARAIGQMTAQMTDLLAEARPDAVLLLGDRGEMLAAAIAAIHLNIPVAHVHGGERSGTVDESVRHAISKLSHLHFTATEASRARLIRLGEDAERVHVTGAPGLDGLTDAPRHPRDQLLAELGLDPGTPTALVLFHPVLQEAQGARDQIAAIFDALHRDGWNYVVLMPNADAGSDDIRTAIEASARPSAPRFVHLPRPQFLDFMAGMDALVGNSSSGIIEAASFGTPVINIGSRQNLRERNANVIDVPAEGDAIHKALCQVRQSGRHTPTNVYGDGQAAGRIAALLRDLPLPPSLLDKVLSY